jgi:hypothetical protein
MKKIIRITESDLTRIVKRVISEQAQGESEFIQTIVDRYNISDELKNEIINTIKNSECKNITFEKLSMGDGLALGDRLILTPGTLNYTLGRFLFILFHELAHQYQFKKYGMEKMLELYDDEMDIKEAAQFMKQVESVADEFAVRKLRNIQRKGLVTPSRSDMFKGYDGITVDSLDMMIKMFRDKLRNSNIKGAKNISEYLYNMVRIKQTDSQVNSEKQRPSEITSTEPKKEMNIENGTISADECLYDIPRGVKKVVGNLDASSLEDFNDVEVIDGNLTVSSDKIKTLQNIKIINGKLWVYGNNFEDFGNLKTVKGDVILTGNIPLLDKYSKDEIEGMINIGGILQIKK